MRIGRMALTVAAVAVGFAGCGSSAPPRANEQTLTEAISAMNVAQGAATFTRAEYFAAFVKACAVLDGTTAGIDKARAIAPSVGALDSVGTDFPIVAAHAACPSKEEATRLANCHALNDGVTDNGVPMSDLMCSKDGYLGKPLPWAQYVTTTSTPSPATVVAVTSVVASSSASTTAATPMPVPSTAPPATSVAATLAPIGDPAPPWAGPPVAGPASLGDLPAAWVPFSDGGHCPLLAPTASWADIGAPGAPGPPMVGTAADVAFIDWGTGGPGAPSLSVVPGPITSASPFVADYMSATAVQHYTDGSEVRYAADGSYMIRIPNVTCAYIFTPADLKYQRDNLFGSLRFIVLPSAPVSVPPSTLPAAATSTVPAVPGRHCPVEGVDVMREGDGFPTPCPRVAYVQSVLTLRGYPVTDADGQFGPSTTRAVKAFQAANGLEVDGLIGPATWAALSDGPTPDY